MKPTIQYRPADNAASLRLSSAKVLESAEVSPDTVFDYDSEGRLVGIELLDARAQLPTDGLISRLIELALESSQQSEGPN